MPLLGLGFGGAFLYDCQRGEVEALSVFVQLEF